MLNWLIGWINLVEEAKDLSADVVALGGVVVDDTVGSGHDDVSEQTGRKQVGHPLFNVFVLDVESGGHNTALVEAAEELNADLAGAVIVNDLEFANVVVALHHLQELNTDFAGRAHQNLLLSALLSIGDGFQSVREDRHTRHLEKGCVNTN